MRTALAVLLLAVLATTVVASPGPPPPPPPWKDPPPPPPPPPTPGVGTHEIHIDGEPTLWVYFEEVTGLILDSTTLEEIGQWWPGGMLIRIPGHGYHHLIPEWDPVDEVWILYKYFSTGQRLSVGWMR